MFGDRMVLIMIFLLLHETVTMTMEPRAIISHALRCDMRAKQEKEGADRHSRK
jgi:hypothetical protein